MNIKVCIGSSCHVNGSKKIVDQFKEELAKHNYQDKVSLSGAFCFGNCSNKGTTIQIDGTIYEGVKPEDFNSFFKTHVVDVIEGK